MWARLLALRAEHSVFRRTTFRHGEQLVDTTNHPSGRKNLAWFGGGRHEMTAEDWHDPHQEGHLPDLYVAMGQTAENVVEVEARPGPADSRGTPARAGSWRTRSRLAAARPSR